MHDDADATRVDGGNTPPGSGGSGRTGDGARLEAALWSPDSPADPDVRITVYVVTGCHGLLTVPERFCRECHMFTRTADAAAERVDAEVAVDVVSWWTRLPWALRHGGYHPPVMVVDGSRLCQGHDVPTTDDVVAAIEAARD